METLIVFHTKNVFNHFFNYILSLTIFVRKQSVFKIKYLELLRLYILRIYFYIGLKKVQIYDIDESCLGRILPSESRLYHFHQIRIVIEQVLGTDTAITIARDHKMTSGFYDSIASQIINLWISHYANGSMKIKRKQQQTN